MIAIYQLKSYIINVSKSKRKDNKMLKFQEQQIYGFDYEIEELAGHATCFTHSNGIDNNVLYKYIDKEHDVIGGGYYDLFEARRDFKKKIAQLQK